MYFTVNIAFTYYRDQFNLMEELEAPILTNKTTLQHTLPIFLNKSMFDDTLLSAPLTLKEYINRYKCDSEIFDLKERHDIDELDIEFVNKNFFTNNLYRRYICVCNSNNISYDNYNNNICLM